MSFVAYPDARHAALDATLEQAEKGFKINSSENTQFNKNFIDKPDEVIKIENYLENINDKYQTFRRKPFKKIIKELGFQKQYTSIKLHELYQLNNFGFVGVISVEYGNFERQGYTASREYQLGIFIRSNLNSKRAQEIIIKHFSESFKTGTIFSSSGITILKLDTHAKLSDLLRIENKMKTLTMEKQN